MTLIRFKEEGENLKLLTVVMKMTMRVMKNIWTNKTGNTIAQIKRGLKVGILTMKNTMTPLI